MRGPAYFDSSVVLAILRGEPTAAEAESLWKQYPQRVSSILWVAECTTVLRRAARSGLPGMSEDWYAAASERLSRFEEEILVVDLSRRIIQRLQSEEALGGARTLDALHLATALVMRSQHDEPEAFALCTFDQTMATLAAGFGFPVFPRPAK